MEPRFSRIHLIRESLLPDHMFEHLAEGRQFEDRDILLDPEIVLKSNIEFYSKNIEYVKYDMFI